MERILLCVEFYVQSQVPNSTSLLHGFNRASAPLYVLWYRTRGVYAISTCLHDAALFHAKFIQFSNC